MPAAGFGSDRTAVFSVIRLSGSGLLPFNSSLGQSFVEALGIVLGIPPHLQARLEVVMDRLRYPDLYIPMI